MRNTIKILLLLATAGHSLLSEGQTFELSKTGTEVAIRGTSSLHDWEMNLNAFNSGFQLSQEGSKIKGLDNVTFSCKATDIKSESSLMDRKAYDALKADDFPDIKFSGLSSTGLAAEGKIFTGNLKGKLNVAGETQDVIIPFNGTFIDSETINIIASTDLNMSSFNITPPTAMLGALKTGDKISVSFSLRFVQKTK
jgi:polyisoprenoid-binding protein YceI